MTELCICCASTNTHEIERERTLEIGGRQLTVAGDVLTKCDNCNTEFYTARQYSLASRKVADAKRKRDGLLTSLEIKLLRKSLALSQATLEAALGVGAKTVVRWENGSAVQSKALDDVLRLIQLDADNLRFLVRIRDQARAEDIDKKLAYIDEKKRADLSKAISSVVPRPVDTRAIPDFADILTTRIRDQKLKRIEKLSATSSDIQPEHRQIRAPKRKRGSRRSKNAA